MYSEGRCGQLSDAVEIHQPSDAVEASRLFKLAADQGHADAQCHLADFCSEGRGGLPLDEREAARLYKLAADQGNAGAQCNLAILYLQARGGLPKDEREAVRLIKLAADQWLPVGPG